MEHPQHILGVTHCRGNNRFDTLLESTDLTVTCLPPGGLFSLNLQFDAAVDA
jgi:hypothetical protein